MMSAAELHAKVRTVHGDSIRVLQVIPPSSLNRLKKLRLECGKCGNEWTPDAADTLRGFGCRVCSTEKSKATKNAQKISVLQKYGFAAHQLDGWRLKYKTFRRNKIAGGFECSITFRQYMKLAARAGLIAPTQIGLRTKQFQMARLGDSGDYVWGNCRFITADENLQEKMENGGTDVAARKISKALTGRTKANSADKASAAKKLSKPFRLVSPTGRVYTGSNLVEFCADHSLSESMMMRLCRGGCRTAQGGWTGKYTGDRGDKVKRL